MASSAVFVCVCLSSRCDVDGAGELVEVAASRLPGCLGVGRVAFGGVGNCLTWDSSAGSGSWAAGGAWGWAAPWSASVAAVDVCVVVARGAGPGVPPWQRGGVDGGPIWRGP